MSDEMHTSAQRPLQPHEQAALNAAQMSPDSVYHLLQDVEALSAKLYRQLVDWHTKFPEKPALHDSNEFWAQLKELRSAMFEVESLRRAIREQEVRANTLSVQLEKAEGTIGHIEKAFSSYLDRMNQR